MRLISLGFLVVSLLLCSQCGPGNGADFGGVDDFGDGSIDEDSSTDLDSAPSPFLGSTTGDDFGWGEFIRSPYQTTSVTSLPISIYLAYFTAHEEEIVKEGIALANEAVGFEVFRVVPSWSGDVRVIYRVDEIFFDDPEVEGVDFTWVVGYTYNRNVYINDQYDAGRVVVDWAIEVRGDSMSHWVVAHELGHAMGIQAHALIDYERDRLLPLEDDSLMAEVIGLDPALDDYNYMMRMQGELLREYLE